MEQKLQVLTKSFEGQDVKIIQGENGEPLFELYSTGVALGYGRWTESKGKKYFKIEKARIDKVMQNGSITGLAHDGQTYLTEDALYDFMLEARTEKVKPFRKWVTRDVLPSIRKHGAYMTDEKIEEILLNPDTIIKLATQLKEEKEKRKIAEQKNVQLVEENEVLVSDVLEWANTATINALVRKYGASLGNEFGKAWIEFKKNLLYGYGINLNSRMTTYLNNSGKKTKPQTLSLLHGEEELTNALKTAIALCKDNNIEVYEILHKHSKDIELNN